MFTLQNFLSFCRFPLALIFLQDNVFFRATAVVLAIITDVLDGYVARRNQTSSQFGAMLDPLADKFFVFFALSQLYKESLLSYWEIAAMLCRDFSVTVFGLYLLSKGRLWQYRFRSIWSGKATTSLQLMVLLALILQIQLPPYLFATFIILGLAALVELAIKHSVVDS